MEFIETPTFTRTITVLLSDDSYAQMQMALVKNPALGDLIRGGGGIRKLRYAQNRPQGGLLQTRYELVKEL